MSACLSSFSGGESESDNTRTAGVVASLTRWPVLRPVSLWRGDSTDAVEGGVKPAPRPSAAAAT